MQPKWHDIECTVCVGTGREEYYKANYAWNGNISYSYDFDHCRKCNGHGHDPKYNEFLEKHEDSYIKIRGEIQFVDSKVEMEFILFYC